MWRDKGSGQNMDEQSDGLTKEWQSSEWDLSNLLPVKPKASRTGLETVRDRAQNQTKVKLLRSSERGNEVHQESLKCIRALKQLSQEDLPVDDSRWSKLAGIISHLQHFWSSDASETMAR
jgi:hypothetical protein